MSSIGLSITVGHSNADIIGIDNKAIQAAVDYVRSLGGGVVEILPGRYLMHDSLHLRSGVVVRGHGSDTVLAKSNGVSSKLVLDGDYGEEQITVADPEKFHPGMGVSIKDRRASGCWQTTVATITGRSGSTFSINRPMVIDYLVSSDAEVTNTFPVISGKDVQNAGIEAPRVEGQKQDNAPLSGCRGGGIYLYRASDVSIRSCTVENFNGDGISYQKCDDITIEDCFVTGNTNFGLHPGSGSKRPTIRRCRVTHNGVIGLFVCWRVKNGVFEDNVFNHNGVSGVSIGHKDTDNLIRNNDISGNGVHGVYFREELEPMAAHRNLVEGNTICDNGNGEEGYGIKIDSELYGVVIRNNKIGSDTPGSTQQRYGVYKAVKVGEVQVADNDLRGNSVGDIYPHR